MLSTISRMLRKEKRFCPPKSQSHTQPSKPPLKRFVPSIQEAEGGYKTLAIDEKGFDHKAFKLLIKAGYNPKEKLSLRKLPSGNHRIAIQEGLTEEENARIRLEELKALDGKRLEAQQSLECYQARLSKAFNEKVRLHSFQVGDLVLAARRPIMTP
ncbi:UNVERIFIED_CONTAM: hypothetical protein Slati_2989900 [Sesamum latifolium]|uniref:Uncharacterized protein n=1 Tax=Sesamum latifolium TaxID=2727402 RepID=A0AAW2VFX2_9LAMI